MAKQRQDGKKKKWPVVLIIVAILTGMTVYGAVFQPNATTKKQAEEKLAAEKKATNIYGNEVFFEKGRYGIKRGDTIIADSVWESIKEAVGGDTVFYVVGYRDKTKGAQIRKEYDSVTGIDDELRYGILDADGKVIVQPQYTDIDAGSILYDNETGRSNVKPYPGSYVVFTDLVPDGGEKNGKKTRERRDYLVRKGTWEIVSDLGDYYFSSFINDEYIVVWRIDRLVDYAGALKAIQPTGIYSISRRELLWSYDNVSTSGIYYYPDLGFAAKTDYKDEKPNVYITMDGRIVRNISEFDDTHGLLWVFDSASRKGKYALYGFDAQPISDIRLDKAPYKTPDGRTIQFVYSASQGYQVFDYDTKTCKTVNGVEKTGPWSEGFAAVMNADLQWGYVNDRGEFLFAYQFDEAESFKNGVASVVQGFNRLTVDQYGNIR
ncbi:MAG: WG repeat-containing protein [Clostridiales bacterium]|nr:WG repeat-containing protein [Clostridiales bacterium]